MKTSMSAVDDEIRNYDWYLPGLSDNTGDGGLALQLTDPPLDKMAAISQTIFSEAFSWMKSCVSW